LSAEISADKRETRVQRSPVGLAALPYAQVMLWLLLIIVLGVVAYRYRVKILARLLGQPERRIERQIGRKKNP
jgi:hypothetical protein